MPRTIDVVMPQMGESLAEGTLVRWLKAPGDAVDRDEPLFEISTDKVDTDVPAPAAGVLKQVLVGEGETVSVGAPVAIIETSQTADAAGTADAPSREAETPGGNGKEAGGHFKSAHAPQLVSFRRDRPAGETAAGTRAPGAGDRTAGVPETPAALSGLPPDRSYSPAVLEAARRGGVPLETLTRLQGSGRGGRIAKKDVERFLQSGGRAIAAASPAGAPAAEGREAVPPEYLYRPGPEDRRGPMSPVRRKIAHHMSWSVRISPHATAFAEADMTAAAAAIRRERERFEQEVGAPLTVTVLAAHAAVRALADFPVLNASVLGDELVFKPHVHLGVAVALPDTDDLIVPVVREADGLSLAGLARAIHDLAGRARGRRLQPDDVQGGTFTLTNPGVFGGLTGTPILNQPQVAILGLGAIVKRPVVIEDAIGIRSVMSIALTFDHRAADGMLAFRYLERFRRLLEEVPDGLSQPR